MTLWSAYCGRGKDNDMFEKVNPCHPDKVADRIAGALVDAVYRKEENPRIAVEVLIGHGICHIIVETSVSIPQDEVKQLFAVSQEICILTMWKCRRTDTLPKIRRVEFAAATMASSKGCL